MPKVYEAQARAIDALFDVTPGESGSMLSALKGYGGCVGITFGWFGDRDRLSTLSPWTHHAPVVEIKPPRGDAVFWIRLVGSLERGRLGPACQFVKG